MNSPHARRCAIIGVAVGYLAGMVVMALIVSGNEPTPEALLAATDPTVSVLIYPADALEAGEPQRMPLSQAVRNAAAGVPVTLVGVEGE